MLKNARIIAFCATIERKLDTVLFRAEDEQRKGSALGTAAKVAGTAGGAYYAGSALKRGLGGLVADRQSGLRATVPGFTKASPLMQTVRATGSVLKDKPLQAAKKVGTVVAGDVGAGLSKAANAIGGAQAALAQPIAEGVVKGSGLAMRGASAAGGLLKRGLQKAAGVFKYSSLQRRVIAFAQEQGLVELGNSALFVGLPDDYERHSEGRLTIKRYKNPRPIPTSEAGKLEVHPDGMSVPHDISPSRIRRKKAIAATVAAAGLGYVAGRYRH